MMFALKQSYDLLCFLLPLIKEASNFVKRCTVCISIYANDWRCITVKLKKNIFLAKKKGQHLLQTKN
jgi:hypothetical protein